MPIDCLCIDKVNRGLLVKFLGELRVTCGFLAVQKGSVPRTLALFKGHLWFRKEVTVTRGGNNSENTEKEAWVRCIGDYNHRNCWWSEEREETGFPQLEEARAPSKPMQRCPCESVPR